MNKITVEDIKKDFVIRVPVYIGGSKSWLYTAIDKKTGRKYQGYLNIKDPNAKPSKINKSTISALTNLERGGPVLLSISKHKDAPKKKESAPAPDLAKAREKQAEKDKPKKKTKTK